MEITTETILLSAIFLLPGYAAHRLTGYFSPTPQRHISTLDSLLTSLGTTLGILLIEAAIATALGAAIHLLHGEWIRQLDLQTLVDHGLRRYTLERPWVVITFVAITAPSTAVLAFWWSLNDPAGRWLRRRQVRLNIAPSDMWVMAFEEDRTRLGFEQVFVSVRVKQSKDVFQGVLKSFSFPTGDGTTRDLYLQNVTYLPEGDHRRATTLRSAEHPVSAAIISSSNIESISAVYITKPPRRLPHT